MRAIVVLLILAATGVASAQPSPAEPTPTPHDDIAQPRGLYDTDKRLGLGMRHAWGKADAYEFTGRYDYVETTEWSDFLASLGIGTGSIGGRTAYLVGASAEMLALHDAGLGVGVQLLRATDDVTGVHFFVRGSVGLRIHGVELSYAYQRQLGGDRYDWMASHMLVVGIHVPLKFDL